MTATPPEHTPELLAKIDLLITLAQKQDERVGRLENRFDRLQTDFMDLRRDFSAIRQDVAEFREYVAEFRGEVRGRIDGLSERISDVNARLPVPIACSPPNKPAA